jgi:hypothetical protein
MARAKKCKQCKLLFTPTKPLQYVCGYECAIAYANKLASKNFNQDIRRRKAELKTRAQWLKEAQAVFNKFIRMRDENNPCISCSRFHTGQYHAGHYRSVGSAPHLRFSELNCHRQCSVCNNHLSGNQINYRRSLIEKIGLSLVEQLEADNEAKHYDIPQIIELKKHYQAKVKELSQ